MGIEPWGMAAILVGGGLLVATYAKYVLKYSLKEYVELFLSEFRELANRDIKPGAINALAVVISSVFLLAALVIPRFDRFLTIGGILPTSSDPVLTSFGAAAFIMFSTFICLSLIKGRPK